MDIDRSFESFHIEASNYQISIKDHLEADWSERLAGMEINNHESESGPFSTLTGKIIDQSELFGVLSALNDYPYTFISVNNISR